MYTELHARSAFSFLEGSSIPEELVAVCAQLHMPAMALLDTDGLYGAPRFHLAAKKIGIKAHIGAEVTALLPRSYGATEKNNQQSKLKNQQLKNSSVLEPALSRAEGCLRGEKRVAVTFAPMCALIPIFFAAM